MKNGNRTANGKDALASLLDFAAEAGLGEVVWEKGDRRIAFKRALAPATPLPAATQSPTLEGGAEAAAPARPLTMIKSPMVGTFLRAAKDRPPLILEGSEVKPGQKLALVEAMQIPKDVICDVTGRVVKIFVDNGRPVEYGQPLFEIEITEAR